MSVQSDEEMDSAAVTDDENYEEDDVDKNADEDRDDVNDELSEHAQDDEDNMTEKEDTVKQVPLTLAMMRAGLSMICKTNNGLQHAFVKLDARERNVTDISLLTAYPYLRYVDLSVNNLVTLEQISCLKNLLSLDVSNNAGLKELRFAEELAFLQRLNLSRCDIGSIGDINCPLLTHLNLAGNRLSEMREWTAAVQTLTKLESLDVSENKLTQLVPLQLSTLKFLSLSSNQLTSLEGLGALPMLQTLNCSDNAIQTLSGLVAAAVKTHSTPRSTRSASRASEDAEVPALGQLTRLLLSSNELESVEELANLELLHKLQHLTIFENPVADSDEFSRLALFTNNAELITIDEEEIGEEEEEELAEARRLKRLQREEENRNRQQQMAAARAVLAGSGSSGAEALQLLDGDDDEPASGRSSIIQEQSAEENDRASSRGSRAEAQRAGGGKKAEAADDVSVEDEVQRKGSAGTPRSQRSDVDESHRSSRNSGSRASKASIAHFVDEENTEVPMNEEIQNEQ